MATGGIPSDLPGRIAEYYQAGLNFLQIRKAVLGEYPDLTPQELYQANLLGAAEYRLQGGDAPAFRVPSLTEIEGLLSAARTAPLQATYQVDFTIQPAGRSFRVSRSKEVSFGLSEGEGPDDLPGLIEAAILFEAESAYDVEIESWTLIGVS